MNISKQLIISFLILLLLIGVSGCGTAKAEDPSVSETDKNTVIIENYKFQPDEITIKSGETITWINKDSVKHTATGDSFDSGLLSKGSSYQQKFDNAGTYDYICTPHPYMKGKIIVE